MLKEFLSTENRESTISWKDILPDLKEQGVTPSLAIEDGLMEYMPPEV